VRKSKLKQRESLNSYFEDYAQRSANPLRIAEKDHRSSIGPGNSTVRLETIPDRIVHSALTFIKEMSMLRTHLASIFLMFVLVAPLSAPAQVMLRKDQPDLTFEPKTAQQIVETIQKCLNEEYVFPETAKTIEADLRRRLENHEYDKITSARKMADLLTDQLQAISKDKHLRVFYSYEPLPQHRPVKDSAPDPNRKEMVERMRKRGRATNYGFEKVERLEGNVGYLDLRMFQPAELAGETAAAAMNFVANTDALIIDLRKNGGGAPSMVALVSSYLFGPEPVHLNDLYFRPEDSTHQWWTLPLVPGQRYEGKPVYVLTSKRTFSAAEEFTYNLKSLKRATIVGETTGGGAHPGGMKPINDHFGIFVPSGRAINPITKTNWEGTGVAPDMPVPADLALKTAHLAALKAISKDLEERRKDPKTAPEPMQVDQIKKAIEQLEKELANGKSDSRTAVR
jgi:hypothetical protein